MNTLAPASRPAALAALPPPTIREKSNPTITTRILPALVAPSVYLHRLCGADKRVMFSAEGALSRLGDSGSGPQLSPTNAESRGQQGVDEGRLTIERAERAWRQQVRKEEAGISAGPYAGFRWLLLGIAL